MKLKVMGICRLTMMSLAWANSANAVEWYVDGAKLSGSTTVKATKATGTTPLELDWTELGFRFGATGIECVGCTIDNNTAGVAHSAGRLRFMGVTVSEPAGCVVASSLETGALTDEVVMGLGTHSTEAYDKFFTDESLPFITIKITECAAAGSYKLSGTVTGHSNNATGVESASQTLRFSSEDQIKGGGALSAGGGKAAVLMGEVTNTLTSALAFSAK